MRIGSWLPSRDLGALEAALASACPGFERDGRTFEADDDRPVVDERSMRSTAALGDDLLVKFAWSQEAAERLACESAVMRLLGAAAPELLLPDIVAWSDDPVLLVTRRVAGEWLWWPEACALDGERLVRTTDALGGFLARLHRPDLLALVTAAGVDLAAPEPQATTAALRSRLGAFVGVERQRKVIAWCDWVDRVLAEPAPAVLLHGDFAGHNLLWDEATGEVSVFYDFEDVCLGDPAYDFRYLPAQADTLEILRRTMAAYAQSGGAPIDLRRVFAWHVRTSLGDALWRSEAGVELPLGGHAGEWVDELEQRFAASGLRPTA